MLPLRAARSGPPRRSALSSRRPARAGSRSSARTAPSHLPEEGRRRRRRRQREHGGSSTTIGTAIPTRRLEDPKEPRRAPSGFIATRTACSPETNRPRVLAARGSQSLSPGDARALLGRQGARPASTSLAPAAGLLALGRERRARRRRRRGGRPPSPTSRSMARWTRTASIIVDAGASSYRRCQPATARLAVAAINVQMH